MSEKHAKVDPKDAEAAKVAAAAKAKQLKLAKIPEGEEKKALRVHLPLAPEHRGEKTYVVGPAKAYRGGKIYNAGELVTIVDERPAADWILYEEEVKAPTHVAKALPAPAGRASDKNVGG